MQGTAELRRALERLRGAERRQAQQDGLEAGARVVETYAKLAAPSTPARCATASCSTRSRRLRHPWAARRLRRARRIRHQPHGRAALLRPAVDEHEREIVDAIEAAVRGFIEGVA